MISLQERQLLSVVRNQTRRVAGIETSTQGRESQPEVVILSYKVYKENEELPHFYW